MRILLILLIFSSKILSAQQYKQDIIKNFDSVEYYSNNMIKCAYTIKHKIPNGYAIEYDESGYVTSIGKYKKGKKEGLWCSSGSFQHYTKGNNGGLSSIPGCGTGLAKQKRDFVALYYKLIKVDLSNNANAPIRNL